MIVEQDDDYLEVYFLCLDWHCRGETVPSGYAAVVFQQEVAVDQPLVVAAGQSWDGGVDLSSAADVAPSEQVVFQQDLVVAPSS